MEIVKEFQNDMHVTIRGTQEEPLFRASDIGIVLEISNIRTSIQHFNETEKRGVHTMDAIGRNQETTFLTEKGLYKILFKSRKPIAEKFQDWVCDVIKEIRINGKYELQHQINDIVKSKEENILTNFDKKPALYVGFAEDNVIKIGYTDNLKIRLKVHKREIKPDFTFEYVYESLYNREIERRIYQHPELKKRRLSKVYLERKEPQTELFKLDSDFTINRIDKIIKIIKKQVETEESNKDKDAEINKLKLRLYEFENNKLKNEVESLKQIIETVSVSEIPIVHELPTISTIPTILETPKVLVETVNKLKTKKCLDCDKYIRKDHTRCNRCSAVVNNAKNRKVEIRPTISEINEMLQTMTMTDIAVKYGVSSNAVKKWIKFEEKKTSEGQNIEKVQKKCLDCDCDIFRISLRCQSCSVKLANLKEPIIMPSLDTIQELLKTMSCVDIATKYKVSDTTVRKWIKLQKQS